MASNSIGAAALDPREAPAPAAAVANRVGARSAAIACIAACGVALVAPFELTRPLIRLPGQSISNLEAVVLAALVSWLVAIGPARARAALVTPLTWPWMALIVAMGVAAVAAPEARLNALHMAGRLGVGFFVYLLTVDAASTPERLRMVVGAMFAAGVVAALLALLESAQLRPVLDGLKAFRPGIAVVGAQLRAGGPLQYPTIAAMYLEIVFALGLGLWLLAIDTSHWPSIAAMFAALVIVGEAIALTVTRTGLVTMAVSLGFVGTGRRHDRAMPLVAALAGVIAVLLFASMSTRSVWLRLTSEGQEAWYRCAIDAPAEVSFATGASGGVAVRVTNTGRLTWDSRADPPFYFSYHWLAPDAARVVSFDGARTEFAAPVAPGATVTMTARVRAPQQPGRYVLAWDVVQEGRLWFSTEPGATAAASRAIVTGAAPHGSPAPTWPVPRQAVRPGRVLLWRAAARMLAAHPLFGVGPDNFRLLYGPYAGVADADPRVHSNNMFIELVVGAGVVGALPFAWLLWRASRAFVAALRWTTRARPAALAVGIAAAGIAILLHGLVDSFLGFTPTYVLISMTLGAAVACARGVEAQPHADCV